MNTLRPPPIADSGQPLRPSDTERTPDALDLLLRHPPTPGRGPLVLEVAQVWGEVVLETRQFSAEQRVTIGSAIGHRWRLLGRLMGAVPASMVPVLQSSPPIWSSVEETWASDFWVPEDVLAGEHELVCREGDGWVTVVDPAWDGFVDLAGERLRFSELVSRGLAEERDGALRVGLRPEAGLVVQIGQTVLVVRLVRPTRAAASAPERDRTFVGLSAACSVLFVMLVLLQQLSPPRPSSDMVEVQERYLEAIFQPAAPEPVAQITPKEKETGSKAGARAKEPEGGRRAEDTPRQLTVGQRRPGEVSRDAGLLAALQDPNIMLSAGLDGSIAAGTGMLIGARGTQIGAGGLGLRGPGLGGGDPAGGPGGLGPRGSGLGPAGRSGDGLEQGARLGEKQPGRLSAATSEAIVMGGIPANIIDGVIKQRLSQIKYCFDRELRRDPSLGGKLTIQFTIARDGSVSQAKVHKSTVGSSAVDQCVVDRFYKMSFPEPTGGTLVVVKYPFLFSGG